MSEQSSADQRADLHSHWKRRLSEGGLNAAEARDFAGFALGQVSRTFALNIRVLPERLRDPVLHAYLYCRMADTLEDDAALPAARKAALLQAFAALFDPNRSDAEAEKSFAAFPSLLPEDWMGTDDWEKILLERAPVVLRAFLAYPAPVRAAIARCVTTMCAGMAEFAALLEARRAAGAPLIASTAELDRYCYFVAGTVGEMLCDLFVDYARIPAARADRMRALCVSFGLGLQLTNILKDRRDDAARGVSWLPPDVSLETLFAKARGHLEEALEFSCLIPRLQRRLRLFCLWPLFMAAETLALLWRGEVEKTAEAGAETSGLKISRARVARILLRTQLTFFSNALLRADFTAAARGVPHLAHPSHTGYL